MALWVHGFIIQSSKPFDVLPTPLLSRFGGDIDFPYLHTGVDYLGPLHVRNICGSKNEDLYKCHKFRHCNRRTFSRYSTPKLFISDNAKNFVGG